jgi:hypothetical protein
MRFGLKTDPRLTSTLEGFFKFRVTLANPHALEDIGVRDLDTAGRVLSTETAVGRAHEEGGGRVEADRVDLGHTLTKCGVPVGADGEVVLEEGGGGEPRGTDAGRCPIRAHLTRPKSVVRVTVVEDKVHGAQARVGTGDIRVEVEI